MTTERVPWVDDDGRELGFVFVDDSGRVAVTYAPTKVVHVTGHVRDENADALRELVLHARRCVSTLGQYRCTRDKGHVGVHRAGSITWGV